MGKILGYVSGIGALALVVVAMVPSATAIPTARTPSVGWLTEMGTPAVAAPAATPAPLEQPKPDALGTLEPAKPAEPAKAEPAKAEPAKVTTPEPAKPAELAKPADPAKVAEPAKPEPKPAEPAKVAAPEPKKPEPAKPAEPAKVAEPAKPPEPKPLAAKPPPAEPKPVAAAPKPEPKPAEPAEPEGVGTLMVNSNPTGGAVFLDGANVGQTPIEIDVPSGMHKVRVMHPTDGIEKKQNVTVKADGTATVNVVFDQ